MKHYANSKLVIPYLFLFVFILFIGQPVYGNIVKLSLNGINDCNGQLLVDINIKASDLGDNTPFSIGSSSLFMNFDPTIVTYSSYQSGEFSPTTGSQLPKSNWLDQSTNANNLHGLLNIVLQRNLLVLSDYSLDKSTWIHIGTIAFDWIGPQLDPGITIHDKFTMFNLSTNDGLGSHVLEDFPSLIIDGHSASATVDRACFADGKITVTFPDLASRSTIEFSVDGGLTFPYSTPDNVGSYGLTGLPAGTYNVWMGWNTGCAVEVGTFTVLQWDLPQVTTNIIGDICGNDPSATQTLTFYFADSPQRTGIAFSINGGATFPHTSGDDVGSLDVPITPGSYDLWVRWGNAQCPIDLPDVSYTISDPPVVTNISALGGCKGNGSIVASFPDDPNQTTIEFSIDGGATFPHSSPDNAGFINITNLSVGSYDVWARWGDGTCWESLTTVKIGGSVPDVRLRAFLQGPLDNATALMNDDLRVQNLIPTTEPYTALGYTHINGNSGAQITNPAKVFSVTGPDAIVDWVFVKYVDPITITPNSLTVAKALLIQRDGDIVELDGETHFKVNSFGVCSASVTVYHRNHLGIKTAKGGVQFTTNSLGEVVLDLTNNSTLLEGMNPASVVNGIQSIWAADATNDALISASDRSEIWNFRNQSGYHLTDVNMDGVVNAADRSYCWNNRNKFGITH